MIARTAALSNLDNEDEFETELNEGSGGLGDQTEHGNSDYYDDDTIAPLIISTNDADGADGEDDSSRDSEDEETPPPLPPHPDQNQLEYNEFRKAIKVSNGGRGLRAEDWEMPVQDVLRNSYLRYENRLMMVNPYPDPMQEIVWAKASWVEACGDCGLKIHYNTELIKLVCSECLFNLQC